MNSSRTLACVIALLAPIAFAASAQAEDQLKVAIGQINNWENQAPTLGQDAGIFKKHGLVLENVGTAGAGETIQAVISGSADIGGIAWSHGSSAGCNLALGDRPGASRMA